MLISETRSTSHSNVLDRDCLITINSVNLYFQRTELQAEKRKALSDEAKHLFREDPGLFKAAEKDFKSIPHTLIFLTRNFGIFCDNDILFNSN